MCSYLLLSLLDFGRVFVALLTYCFPIMYLLLFFLSAVAKNGNKYKEGDNVQCGQKRSITI